MELDFQERIARAKEAARLASIAAMARDAPPHPRAATSSTTGYAGAPVPPAPPFPSAHAIPVDVRERIDRLVEFIARNGPVFEDTAREREKHNPDFAFLRPGAPYHDYFQWKKQQAMTPVAKPALSVARAPLANRAPLPNWTLPLSPHVPEQNRDVMQSLSVGAMANVCKLARQRGVPPYAPIPTELLIQAASLPPVEPARLDTRVAEFYRSTLMS